MPFLCFRSILVSLDPPCAIRVFPDLNPPSTSPVGTDVEPGASQRHGIDHVDTADPDSGAFHTFGPDRPRRAGGAHRRRARRRCGRPRPLPSRGSVGAEGRAAAGGHGPRPAGRGGRHDHRAGRGLPQAGPGLRLHRHDLRHAPDQGGLPSQPSRGQRLARRLPARAGDQPAAARLLHDRRAGRRRRAHQRRAHRTRRRCHPAGARRHGDVLRRPGRCGGHHGQARAGRRAVRPGARGVPRQSSTA